MARLPRNLTPDQARPIWSVRLTKLREMPPMPADPTFLGRVLAELSRRDFPLSATFSTASSSCGAAIATAAGYGASSRAALAQAEQAASASPHRRPRDGGPLRAPPGGLDEVTSTVVPGERVYVAEEGGWGRHLPTVDDMLDLPIWTGDPVRVYSSTA